MKRESIKLNNGVSGIYCIECLTTGKIYIGSSVDIKNRWHCHKSELNLGIHTNRHLQAEWIAYGESEFAFSIVEECDRDNIIDREQFYLDLYKSYNRDVGYNIVMTAYAAPMTEESRKRQAESLKSNTEFMEKCRDFMKELHADPVRQQHLLDSIRNSEKVKERLRQMNASEEHKQQVRELLDMVHNDPRIQEHVKNMANDNRLDYNWRKLHKVKNVAQFEVTGEFVQIYRSLGEIEDTTDFNRGTVSKACKSGKEYDGYLWKFIEDDDYDEFMKIHERS